MTVEKISYHSSQKEFTSSVEYMAVGRHRSIALAVSKTACLYNQTFLGLVLRLRGWWFFKVTKHYSLTQHIQMRISTSHQQPMQNVLGIEALYNSLTITSYIQGEFWQGSVKR